LFSLAQEWEDKLRYIQRIISSIFVQPGPGVGGQQEGFAGVHMGRTHGHQGNGQYFFFPFKPIMKYSVVLLSFISNST
jgi:hypothetical protein